MGIGSHVHRQQPIHKRLSSDASSRLAAECTLFTRYLVRREAPTSVAQRYVRAHQYILPASEDAVVAWAMRHPWALCYLDAACGLGQPDGLLRRKLLVLTAILEATPQFADEFLPEPTSAVVFCVRMIRYGAAALLKGAVGLLLFRWVRMRT